MPKEIPCRTPAELKEELLIYANNRFPYYASFPTPPSEGQVPVAPEQVLVTPENVQKLFEEARVRAMLRPDDRCELELNLDGHYGPHLPTTLVYHLS